MKTHELFAARIVAKVYYANDFNDRYPWHYDVEAFELDDVNGDPATIDYGSAKTRDDAWATVSWVLKNRDRCDYPEYYHVRADRR